MLFWSTVVSILQIVLQFTVESSGDELCCVESSGDELCCVESCGDEACRVESCGDTRRVKW